MKKRAAFCIVLLLVVGAAGSAMEFYNGGMLHPHIGLMGVVYRENGRRGSNIWQKEAASPGCILFYTSLFSYVIYQLYHLVDFYCFRYTIPV